MTKSDMIRSLAGQGLSVSEIAQQIGVRYQHAYNVLKRSGMLTPTGTREQVLSPEPAARPALSTECLLKGGFEHIADWSLASGELKPTLALPKRRGVYAFVKDDAALYVGVATKGIAKRLYFYGKPGVTQRTSIRIGAALKAELETGSAVAIYAAMPPDLEWNGLPVSGDVGLELGLIEAFTLPWNRRGT